MPPWVLGDDCDDLAPTLVRLLLERKDGLSNGDVREHAASIGAAFVALAQSSDTTVDPEWDSGRADDFAQVIAASS